ncbi:hypothetical protein [Leptospira kanakyensis]|uniref:hypothetical protein n=1 Tax=Leptospira kanakyensis TaxID=2484968 RepID=UPI00223D9CB1|nr:hypothetical protein [Leptospira kanakyensis]MCW7470558.1 hypothetical protein [Leptospira kanakyensis]
MSNPNNTQPGDVFYHTSNPDFKMTVANLESNGKTAWCTWMDKDCKPGATSDYPNTLMKVE